MGVQPVTVLSILVRTDSTVNSLATVSSIWLYLYLKCLLPSQVVFFRYDLKSWYCLMSTFCSKVSKIMQSHLPDIPVLI